MSVFVALGIQHEMRMRHIDICGLPSSRRVWKRGWAYTEYWWGKLMERDHLEDSRVDGRKILTRVSRKWDVEVWIGSSWLGIGTGGTCEWGKELSGSIKRGNFLIS